MSMHNRSSNRSSNRRTRRGPGGGHGPLGRGGPMAMMKGDKARDFKGTMAKLVEYLGKYKLTVLIVTQRVSTVKNADQIIVLEKGRIVGKGAHQQLMDTCETYREIALSQLSLEELA